MIVRKQRLKNGWSQKQLAEMAGLTTRTIQRIERGHKGSIETYKALAAVFETDFETIQSEQLESIDVPIDESLLINREEQEALLYAKRIKEFYEVLICYGLAVVVFFILFSANPMLYFIFGALGICIFLQGLLAFEVIGIFTPAYEKRLAEKKLGRKI